MNSLNDKDFQSELDKKSTEELYIIIRKADKKLFKRIMDYFDDRKYFDIPDLVFERIVNKLDYKDIFQFCLTNKENLRDVIRYLNRTKLQGFIDYIAKHKRSNTTVNHIIITELFRTRAKTLEKEQIMKLLISLSTIGDINSAFIIHVIERYKIKPATLSIEYNGYTLFEEAAYNNDIDLVEFLVRSDVSILSNYDMIANAMISNVISRLRKKTDISVVKLLYIMISTAPDLERYIDRVIRIAIRLCHEDIYNYLLSKKPVIRFLTVEHCTDYIELITDRGCAFPMKLYMLQFDLQLREERENGLY